MRIEPVKWVTEESMKKVQEDKKKAKISEEQPPAEPAETYPRDHMGFTITFNDMSTAHVVESNRESKR